MERPTENTEKLLLQRIAEGNEQAFRTIFDRYSDNLYGVAYNYTKSKETAQELVQDVFLKIWIKRAELARIENLENYLFISARNLIMNYFRSQKRNAAFLERLAKHFSEAALDPQDQLIRKESLTIINNAVNSLPEQQRTVYNLRRNEGLSIEEIATRMAISPNTVRNHMNAALRSVREKLMAHPDDLVLFLCLAWMYAT
jgi:RNA polymerase sigma-70 factor (ECF subfamily)